MEFKLFLQAMDFLYHDRGSKPDHDKHYQGWIRKHGHSSLTKFEALELAQEDGPGLEFGSKADGGVVKAIIDEDNQLDAVDKLSQVMKWIS